MVSGRFHFSRPPTIKQVKAALKEGAQKIFMPKSCVQRLSAKAKKMLSGAEVEIATETFRGRAIAVSPEKVMEIAELHNDHRTYRQIEKITGVPKSTVHYLIKYAERQKLKRNGKIIYL